MAIYRGGITEWYIYSKVVTKETVVIQGIDIIFEGTEGFKRIEGISELDV